MYDIRRVSLVSGKKQIIPHILKDYSQVQKGVNSGLTLRIFRMKTTIVLLGLIVAVAFATEEQPAKLEDELKEVSAAAPTDLVRDKRTLKLLLKKKIGLLGCVSIASRKVLRKGI